MILPDDEWRALKNEVLVKFEEIFGIETEERKASFRAWLESIDEDSSFEKLRMTYWYNIVEPGWSPALFGDLNSDDMNYNNKCEMIDEAMKQACDKLGINKEILE